MSSIPKYIQLISHIDNWALYFRRKHKKGQTARYVTKNARLVFDVPPLFYDVFREIFMEDFYKIKQLASHIPEKPVIIDIGGNVGYFSFLISDKKPGARIYAFEPMEKNLRVFQNNVNLNKGLEKNIFISQKAVTGDFNGELDIFFDSLTDNSVVASVIEQFSPKNNSSTKVAAISLEKIISDNKLEKVDLLKVDCEGSEYPIFYQSPPHIFDIIDSIAIETHELDGDTRNATALIAFLRNKGYTVNASVGENDCFYVEAFRVK